jgi:hypothetical protein
MVANHSVLLAERLAKGLCLFGAAIRLNVAGKGFAEICPGEQGAKIWIDAALELARSEAPNDLPRLPKPQVRTDLAFLWPLDAIEKHALDANAIGEVFDVRFLMAHVNETNAVTPLS